MRLQHLLVLIIFTSFNGSAKLVLTMEQADSIFLKRNLHLLAGNLNIGVQKAIEIQNRCYPNPSFLAEFNAIDPQNRKYFNAGANGQKAASLEQLIILGGKRRSQMELAKLDTRLAEFQLQDLLRNLKQKIHASLYEIYFSEVTIQKFDIHLALLDTIILNYEVQAVKGNVSLKDIVRLKSAYLQLNNDRSELLQGIQERQKDLQVMLQTQEEVTAEISISSLNSLLALPTPDSLESIALANRADWQASLLEAERGIVNLKLQKSLAIPDLTIGAAYDQRGGAFNNQVNMSIGLPVPLWNRNKGNIAVAQTEIQLADVNKNAKRSEVIAEVAEAWNNMRRNIQEYQKSRQLYNDGFDKVFNGITENFRKRNISMLEFVDFFEAYNESVAQINRIQKQLVLSAEAINYVVAANIYK